MVKQFTNLLVRLMRVILFLPCIGVKQREGIMRVHDSDTAGLL
jgi:hypothetical protein